MKYKMKRSGWLEMCSVSSSRSIWRDISVVEFLAIYWFIRKGGTLQTWYRGGKWNGHYDALE